MGILNWLSQPKDEGVETPEQRAQRKLEESRGLVATNPKKAIDALYQLGKHSFDHDRSAGTGYRVRLVSTALEAQGHYDYAWDETGDITIE